MDAKREMRAFEALIVSLLRDGVAAEKHDPSNLPQLTEDERAALDALGPDIVERLWQKAQQLTIGDWVRLAPREVRSWLDVITVRNFLRQERNRLFQIAGAHDGSISDTCKQSFLQHRETVNQIIQALKGE